MPVFKKRAENPTMKQNPKIVFIGQGRNPGIPNFIPLVALKTDQPEKTIISGRDIKESAGKLV